MANAPHGGVLKVCTYCLLASTTDNFFQDLIARDAGISFQLREEAAGLPDIVLTEVLYRLATLGSYLFSPFSANYATLSSSLTEGSALLKDS